MVVRAKAMLQFVQEGMGRFNMISPDFPFSFTGQLSYF
jgi:hypothetical protein